MMDDYKLQHKAKMDEMLLVMPGVKAGKAFGYPAYKINGKVFAFVGGRGVAIKLPAQRVNELIDGKHIKPFEPADGYIWKEWISIQRDDPAEYEQDEALFEESVTYVLEITS
ncbi:MAG: hypothetical protein J0L63_02835 [Anaerolineae bacterium]|nr:hypothetical protein [Anaerolineae bacterium]